MFREWWKKQSYWLRGGLIGGTLYAIVGLISLILLITCPGEEELGCLVYVVPIYPVFFLFEPILDFFGTRHFPGGSATIISQFIETVISTFMVGFLVGTVIGLIIKFLRRG